MSYYLISKQDSAILNFDCMGFSQETSKTRFGPTQRENYIIHYVLKGKGIFNGNTVTSGQGFIITPHQFEHYYPDNNDPWEFLWFVSRDERFEDLLDSFNVNENNIFEHNSTNEILNVAETLKIRNNQVVSSNEILELFLSVYNSHTKDSNSNTKQSNSDIYLDFAMNYINNNIYENLTISKLTEILGISQVYLFKIFKNKFGISTKQYINECKIKKAKKLLKETNLSITKISANLGYNDVLTFSKFFSKNVGISPKNYRSKEKTI